MTQSGIEPATFRLVAQRLTHRPPHSVGTGYNMKTNVNHGIPSV